MEYPDLVPVRVRHRKIEELVAIQVRQYDASGSVDPGHLHRCRVEDAGSRLLEDEDPVRERIQDSRDELDVAIGAAIADWRAKLA